MSLYLRVGVSRVRTYLARTPRLSLLRGASKALEHKEMMQVAGASGFQSVSSAPRVDAIVTVRSDDGAEPRTEATRLAAAISSIVPAAEMTVSWVWADNDDVAVGELAAIQAGGRSARGAAGQALPDSGTIDVLPAANELPALRTCEACRLDSATTTIQMPEDDEPTSRDVCQDCSVRHETSKRIRRNSKRGGWTFDHLAALDEPSANHLATIHIDANRLGSVFDELSRKEMFREMTKLSRGIAESVQTGRDDGMQAVAEVLECAPDDAVLVHLAGGDDLLVSAPARAAWLFAETCVRSMTTAMRTEVKKLENVDVDVSVSAGLVFADAHYPFSATSDLAYEVLRHAKAEVKGEEASMSWADVTVEGRRIPPGRAVLPEAAVYGEGKLRPALREFAKLPKSTRRSLARRTADGLDACRAEVDRLGAWQAEALVDLDDSDRSGFMPAEAELLTRRWWHD